MIRLLDKALITPLDSGRTQLVWITQDGNPLKFILRSELGDGPLALLKLQGSACQSRFLMSNRVPITRHNSPPRVNNRDDDPEVEVRLMKEINPRG